MDKSGIGNVTKAIVPAPVSYEPIRDVEFGCEHLQQFMGDEQRTEKLTNAYEDLLRRVARSQDVSMTKDPKNPSHAYTVTLLPTYICMQCLAVSTLHERSTHGELAKHHFSVESRNGYLWCGLCDDFVYDPIFEKIRMGEPISLATRKRKADVYNEDDRFVHENASRLSCIAGEPRGLYNLGQTCYMSVIIQAMVHNPIVRNYFMSGEHETTDCPIENCVSCALTASFIDILAREKLDGHGPIDMLWKSWNNNPSLAGYHQQDAHEYFQSLLDHLHNSAAEKSEDSRRCKCIFHQIFWGKCRSTVTCLSCKNTTTADDPFLDLSLDLRQQAKRRKLDTKAPNGGKTAQAEDVPLELTDCLANYTSPEKLGADSYTCKSSTCGNTPQRAKKHLTIKKLPPTLCIQLKRYDFNKANSSKLDTALTFPMQLDMLSYTTRVLQPKTKKSSNGEAAEPPLPKYMQPLAPRSPGWYDLTCVVVHVGKMDAGHYVCFCRKEDQWFKFDDSKVTLAGEQMVLEQEPYLLFYVQRNLGPADKPKAADSSGIAKTSGDGEE